MSLTQTDFHFPVAHGHRGGSDPQKIGHDVVSNCRVSTRLRGSRNRRGDDVSLDEVELMATVRPLQKTATAFLTSIETRETQ
jgi:hypothetical protein